MHEEQENGSDDSDESGDSDLDAYATTLANKQYEERLLSGDYINHPAELNAKLREFRLGSGALTSKPDRKVPWIQTLSLTSGRPLEMDGVSAGDDLQRELGFYSQALAAVSEGYRRFEAIKVKYARPADYFAEMVKSDEHMQRIKSRVLGDKRRVAEAEQRRVQREMKRFGKQVQVQREQAKVAEKKASVEELNRWRKSRRGNTSGGDDKEAALPPSMRSGGRGGARGGRRGGMSRTELKAKKYGFGGKKEKRNTRDSASSMGGFRVGLNQGRRLGPRGGGGGGGGKSNRPGKARRAASRN